MAACSSAFSSAWLQLLATNIPYFSPGLDLLLGAGVGPGFLLFTLLLAA